MPAIWVIVVLEFAVTVDSERLLQFFNNRTGHQLREFLPIEKEYHHHGTLSVITTNSPSELGVLGMPMFPHFSFRSWNCLASSSPQCHFLSVFVRSVSKWLEYAKLGTCLV